MLRSLDIWRCAIIKRPAQALTTDDFTPENLVWLPESERRFTFRADPFGLWRNGQLHIFAETFDYRDARGRIELLVYDETLDLLKREIVLSKPWHLSYPFLFEADGDTYMLPEARRSGALTLYRAADFPRGWKPVTTIDAAPNAVDGTLLFHQGRWWLFQAVVRRGRNPASELHVAFADRLDGPWRMHPLNPVRSGVAGTRPAGTPQVRGDGSIDLPVQDCSRTYGGAIRKLRITRLDEARFDAEDSAWLEPAPAFAPFIDGVHTLSDAGPVSLIDCKRIQRSLLGTLTWQRGRMARRRAARELAK